MTTRRPASEFTRRANASPGGRVFDPADEERARRGFIAALDDARIVDDSGRLVHDIGRYAFLAAGSPNPDTVNPHLWRHATLNANHGLFEVCDGIWQVRGYDISNVTFVRGATGWIVIDPLTSEQTARASLGLANRHLGERPVTAVIYTHSHVDHFGGVLGVTTKAEVDAGRCTVIAPEGFLRETVGENVIAGPAMARRASYQFGAFLEPGPDSHVDCGLGTAAPSSAPTLIAPTVDIRATGEELVVDGVRIVFQLTPETEAPAEMNFSFPDHRALCMAENCSHTMHNLVPIRGALVRNALNWSKYLDEALVLFGSDTDVLFTSHNWPRFGREDAAEFLGLQRDLYRWIHDQTMRHANHGWNALEIAESLELPEEFQRHEHTRGFYGDLVHNVKAVFQRYLSWYDGNPVNLYRLPPVEAGRRYVELAGGADALVAAARRAHDAGEYRWAAELLNHVIFADAAHAAARELQADTLEQLGYQAESSTFRNAYLMGAKELRDGPPKPTNSNVRGRNLLREMTVEQVFDTLAVRLRSEDVGGVSVAIDWRFTDVGEDWVLGISNRTLHSRRGRGANPAATVTLSREVFLEVIVQTTTFLAEMEKGAIVVEGDTGALLSIFGGLDSFAAGFPLVEP
jgi:alkyl sulfatase BDS1-like metallo-beta-lactamase superfamily hydrolase